jgi:hypothetical protein
LQRKLFAAMDPHAGLGFAAADKERAGVDPCAQAAPRELRQQLRRSLIEAAARELGGDR